MDKDSENSNSPKSKDIARAFGCPCGKTYLSYPALFTHVKQKHDGKAPGNLIKPKTGKIRGRPKTRVDPIDVELQEIMTRIEADIPLLVEEEIISYDKDFEKSEGNLTCQDAASAFLDHFEGIIESGFSILICFMNEVKNSVESKLGFGFWEKEKPDEIIDIANDLYMNHEEKKSEFPISKELLKELTFNFFEWLFAQKFTNHRLIRVNKDKVCNIENESENENPVSEEDSDENEKNEEVKIRDDVKISS